MSEPAGIEPQLGSALSPPVVEPVAESLAVAERPVPAIATPGLADGEPDVTVPPTTAF